MHLVESSGPREHRVGIARVEQFVINRRILGRSTEVFCEGSRAGYTGGVGDGSSEAVMCSKVDGGAIHRLHLTSTAVRGPRGGNIKQMRKGNSETTLPDCARQNGVRSRFFHSVQGVDDRAGFVVGGVLATN